MAQLSKRRSHPPLPAADVLDVIIADDDHTKRYSLADHNSPPASYVSSLI